MRQRGFLVFFERRGDVNAYSASTFFGTRGLRAG